MWCQQRCDMQSGEGKWLEGEEHHFTSSLLKTAKISNLAHMNHSLRLSVPRR